MSIDPYDVFIHTSECEFEKVPRIRENPSAAELQPIDKVCDEVYFA